ncbi:MAG TPA: ATP-binding protein [Stellaceae bacterium]|nr:ATP-binding protein [Stellaceae bacterium]
MTLTSTLLEPTLGLLQNAALLVLGVLGYCWARGPLSRQSRWVRESIEGVVCAALALLCVVAPLWLSEGVRIDSRNAIIAVSVIFSGPLAGFIAAAVTALFRLWLGGIGALGGALIALGTYLTALAYRYWLRRSGSAPSYRQLAVLGLLVYAFMVVGLVIHPVDVALEILQTVALPALAIIPGSVFLLGSLVLRFDRDRALEHAIAASEARLRSIIDNLPHPLTIKDRDNRFLVVNKAFERATGLSAPEVIGQSMDVVTEMVTGGGALSEVAREVWRTGETHTTEPLWFRFRGRRYSVIVTSFPIRNAEGNVDAIGAINIDVSELAEAREQLERRRALLERQQRALTEMVRANAFMERSVTFSDAVRAITEMAGEVMEVEYTHVFEIDNRAGVARCLDEWVRSAARHDRAPDADLRQYEKLLADVDREQVIAITDLMADPRVAARREVMNASGVQSGIIAGIYLGADMLGYVAFVDVTKRRWTAEEMAFARSIADLIALMMVTSRHREALASLDLVEDGIYVEREDGRVIYANHAALIFAGQPAAATATYDRATSFPRAPAPLEADRDQHEITWVRDGMSRDLQLHRTRLPGGGIVSVIEDVTEKKAEIRDRERLQRHLQQASKMEAIGQLASGIAHDFNNLLGAIIGFAGFLVQDLPAGSEQHQFAERILRACHRGKDLVAQILAFTRTRTLEKRVVDLRSVLKESRELLAGSLPSTRRLVFEPVEQPLVVEGNEAELGQLIVNLCLNAHDAMGADPGEITVSLARIRPGHADFRRTLLVGELAADRTYARLDVTDVGAGIPSENLPRIFEPFFTTKERGRGTGLGLAVAHGIITSSGGACAVTSRTGHGTRFSVYLPLSKKPVAAADIAAPRDLRGRERILVVDDEVDITDMLSIGLERMGYEVAALNDPTETLELVAEDPSLWHAAIIDHLMPGMQGATLAAKLKSLHPELVIILCTGLDDGAVRRQAGAAIDAFFVKPVEPEQLAAAIREMSSGSRGGPAE